MASLRRPSLTSTTDRQITGKLVLVAADVLFATIQWALGTVNHRNHEEEQWQWREGTESIKTIKSRHGC